MFEFLAGLFIPSPGPAIRRVQERVRPNPYAGVAVPDQTRVAIVQGADARRGELQAGFSSLTGSEAEADYWGDEQGRSTIGWQRIRQAIGGDGSGIPMPPSMFEAGDPGRDPDDPTVLADFDRSPHANETEWGASSRGTMNTKRARILPFTLNPPGAVTPTPRAVAAATAERPDVLMGLWSD